MSETGAHRWKVLGIERMNVAAMHCSDKLESYPTIITPSGIVVARNSLRTKENL